MERGERLESMEDRANNLQNASMQFQHSSRRVNRRYILYSVISLLYLLRPYVE